MFEERASGAGKGISTGRGARAEGDKAIPATKVPKGVYRVLYII